MKFLPHYLAFWSRASKCHGHTDLCPQKILLNLRKIIKFVGANWNWNIFVLVRGILLVFFDKFIVQNVKTDILTVQTNQHLQSCFEEGCFRVQQESFRAWVKGKGEYEAWFCLKWLHCRGSCWKKETATLRYWCQGSLLIFYAQV